MKEMTTPRSPYEIYTEDGILHIDSEAVCLELFVNYELSTKFRALLERKDNCKIFNVVEIVGGKILLYIVSCPKEDIDKIVNMAFMTWIKNPEYQEYYKEEEFGGKAVPKPKLNYKEKEIGIKVIPNPKLIHIPTFC